MNLAGFPRTADAQGDGNSLNQMRKLVPALPPSAEDSGLAPSRPPPSPYGLVPAITKTKSPCGPCKQKRTKCDGRRPTCGRCASSNITCVYEGPDLNWVDRMRAELSSSTSDLRMMQQLVDGLRSGSDEEASFILARLRLGEPLDVVAQSLPPSSSSSATPSPAPRLTQPAFPSDSATSLSSPAAQTPQLQVPADVMLGNFVAPSFDRAELSRAPETLSAEEMDWSDARIVLLCVPDDANTKSQAGRRTILWPPEGAPPETVAVVGGRARGTRQPPRPELRVHANILTSRGKEITDSSSPGKRAAHLFVPRWSVMTVHTQFDGTAEGVFSALLDDARDQLAQGHNCISILGEHAHMAALFDPHEFDQAPVLSKWAARVVHSFNKGNYNMTVFGSMYVFWWVARWMIDPSPEHFDAIPGFLQPVPNQLFMPHPMMLDFVIWPALREYVVQYPSQHVGMNWLLDLSETIVCEWPRPTEDALCQNGLTGKSDLTEDVKAHISRLENWSLGPSIRQYIPNVDSFVSIRPVT